MDQGIKKGTIVTTLIVIIILIGGTWSWVKFYKSDEGDVPLVQNDEPIMDITAKHQFKDGKHIIAGEVNLPTPCYILDTEAVVAESYPEQVTLKFIATTQAEMCAQVITVDRFKVEFNASKDAVIKATWNGKPAKLNLIPAGTDEDLNNFEIFIK